MPSDQLPSADNDYQSPIEGFNLSTEVWNALFASISERLKDLEAVQADFDALIAAGTSDAIAVITDNVAPQMTAIQATIDNASNSLNAALDLLASLEVNGVSANKVNVATIAGIASLNAQTVFEEIKGIIDAIVSTTIPDEIATRVAVTNKASAIDAQAGTNDSKYMTPSTTAQAITAICGDTVVENFITSSTFTKESDDIGYMIELWGGGGGGANQTGSGPATGGGGGEYVARFIAASLVGATESVVIGAGGIGTPNAAVTGGTAGGNTTFGSILTARGGQPGDLATLAGAGGGGQRNSNGGYASGAGGSGPISPPSTSVSVGASSTMGGCGGGGASGSSGSAGGISNIGGNGGAGVGTAATKGGNGAVRGGGGGASTNNGGGGDGGRGELRITRFKRLKQ